MTDPIISHPLIHEPFPYHKKLRDHFKKRTKTWTWFSDEQTKIHQIENFKKEVLKNTYRLTKESHKNVFDIALKACNILGIDAVPYFYQENNSIELNASIVVIEKEVHIVFSGSILELLNEDQLTALIAHELSHYLFFKIEDGTYEVTQRIVLALANDSRSEPALVETARIFQLYLELFCDLGALKVCGDAHAPIEMLVKLDTGLSTVNAKSYLDQAREIINKDYEGTNQPTHPESYLRSISLDLKAQNHEDYYKELHILIEGKWDINSVDIFEQEETRTLTHTLIQLILKPSWINTDTTLNLAQQFFPKFSNKSEPDLVKNLSDKLKHTTPSTRSYLSYVLLDFARVDRDLEKVPLAHTLQIAELLGLIDDFEKVARKELKLTIKDFSKLKATAVKDLSNITQNQNDSIYDHE